MQDSHGRLWSGPTAHGENSQVVCLGLSWHILCLPAQLTEGFLLCCSYEGLTKNGSMHSHGVLTFPNKDR